MMNYQERFQSVRKIWMELNDVGTEYLNERGLAAQEAYQSILWHMMFHDSFKSLSEDEEFNNLINVPDKHPEYYRVIRVINRWIERIMKEEA